VLPRVPRRVGLVTALQYAFSLRSRAQLLQFGGGRPVITLATVGLVLTDPVLQRLRMHAQLLGWRRITGFGSDPATGHRTDA
jgi:hypothetical protein